MPKHIIHFTPALAAAVCLALLGCSNVMEGKIDARKYLDTLEGPKVEGVQDAMVKAAEQAESQGNYRQAAQNYQQLSEKYKENVLFRLKMAENLRKSGEYEKAMALYDAALKENPGLTEAQEGRGLVLMGKGDFDAAGRVFAEIMKTERARWKTLNALGILFTTKNLMDEAQQYYREALKFSPRNPSIYNNMGLTQALDRKFDAAVDSLRQAAAFAPAEGAARQRVDLNLALVYGAAGRLPEAEQIARVYFSGPSLKNNMGLYAHLAKNDALAKAYLNMALTESKVHYEKAWDNLESLSQGGSGGKEKSAAIAGPAETPAASVEPAAAPVAEKPKPAVKKAAAKKNARTTKAKSKAQAPAEKAGQAPSWQRLEDFPEEPAAPPPPPAPSPAPAAKPAAASGGNAPPSSFSTPPVDLKQEVKEQETQARGAKKEQENEKKRDGTPIDALEELLGLE